MTRRGKSAACFLALALLAAAAVADDERSISSDKRALAPLQTYVGTWRGVGQPKRGSNQGAWTEESEWAWRFENGRAELCGRLSGDKYYVQLRLRPGNKPGQFLLLATPAGSDKVNPDAPVQQFVGAQTDGALVLGAENALPDRPARITARLVAGGDRLVLLFEKRLGEGVYARMAEVGSTRKGSSFAKNAASGPECVVTGGLGTIPVEYKGKKYFVCCTGCRDLFRDDPEGVLEDYRQRKAAEAAQKNDK